MAVVEALTRGLLARTSMLYTQVVEPALGTWAKFVSYLFSNIKMFTVPYTRQACISLTNRYNPPEQMGTAPSLLLVGQAS